MKRVERINGRRGISTHERKKRRRQVGCEYGRERKKKREKNRWWTRE